MRRAQPALRHRGMRIDRADKRYLAQARTEDPEHDKDIGVLGAGAKSAEMPPADR